MYFGVTCVTCVFCEVLTAPWAVFAMGRRKVEVFPSLDSGKKICLRIQTCFHGKFSRGYWALNRDPQVIIMRLEILCLTNVNHNESIVGVGSKINTAVCLRALHWNGGGKKAILSHEANLPNLQCEILPMG